MIVIIDEHDLISALVLSGMAEAAQIVSQSVTVTNTVNFRRKLSLGAVEASLALGINSEHGIEINIVKATIMGMGMFGAVRKKLGDYLIKVINDSQKYVSAYKYLDGNIRLRTPGILFQSIIVDKGISLTFTIKF